jgi:hypothetical protein
MRRRGIEASGEGFMMVNAPDAGRKAFAHYGRIVIVARFERTVS